MSTIRKHIDLIAVGILLCGIGIYSHVHSTIAFEMSRNRVGFTQQFHHPVVVVPAIPPIPFTRD